MKPHLEGNNSVPVVRPLESPRARVPRVRARIGNLGLIGGALLLTGTALLAHAATTDQQEALPAAASPGEGAPPPESREIDEQALRTLIQTELDKREASTELTPHERAVIKELAREMKGFDSAELIAILGLLMNAAGILFIWKQVKAGNTSLKFMAREIDKIEDAEFLTTYLQFTDRFNAIIDDLESGNVLVHKKALRRYFELCSQEYFLWKRKRSIPDDVWEEWVEGMRSCMQDPKYQAAWKLVKAKRWYGPDFIAFMDGLAPAGASEPTQDPASTEA